MTFSNSVKTCFRKSFTFEGRASRSEYWYFYLFLVLIFLVPALFAVLAAGSGAEKEASAMLVIVGLLEICCIPAGISVMVRRFHDINRSGWNFWWSVIPYIGSVIVLIFMLMPTEAGENKYGPVSE